MKLIILLTVGLIACNQSNRTTIPDKEKDTVTLIHSDTLAPADKIDETKLNAFKYDSTIYNLYISKHLKSIIDKELPDWHLLNPESWDDLWFQEYRNENALVNYISGDFNCDTKQDYALLLADIKNELAVWVIQSNSNNYEIVKIHKLGELQTPVQTGIELIPKGKLDYIDLDTEESKSIRINCPGIQVVHFESAAVTYYWYKGRFESVQTAD